MQQTHNVHVRSTEPLIAPRDLKAQLPMSEAANATVVRGRETVEAVLSGTDKRLLVVVGPCSIHNEQAALEYAGKLSEAAAELQDRLCILMRVYFEKPRTTIGWKGLIYDPHLDGSFDIAAGMRKAREILLAVNELGLPAATEMLDPITPQYTADLVSWASIGARTTESQTHRQMASGLSMPVGYKNATDGNLQIAIDAMQAAGHMHSFLGIDQTGRTCVVNTTGNPWGHLILRGGRSGPNFAAAEVAVASEQLKAAGLKPQIMVDCSHANSEKDHTRQMIVWKDVVAQRVAGNENIIGMMLESNLAAGKQPLSDPANLQYGVSITDACLGWDETRELLEHAYSELGEVACETP